MSKITADGPFGLSKTPQDLGGGTRGVCIRLLSFDLNPPLCKAETRCKYLVDLKRPHILRGNL